MSLVHVQDNFNEAPMKIDIIMLANVSARLAY